MNRRRGGWLRAHAIALSLAHLTLPGGCSCGGPGGAGANADASTHSESGLRDGPEVRRDGRAGGDAELPCVDALPVDILWVVDNSHSMREEQNNLAANFPRLVQTLTNPPDSNRDGEPDYPPVTDLRLGIVSTDLGVGMYTGIVNCDAEGDRAALIGRARTEDPACASVSLDPPFVTYDPAAPAQAEQQFSCLARLGIDGCGLEQQLEVSLRALTERAAPGEPNAGFVRDHSLLAIVLVTDEEDCSAADPSIFDPSPAAVERLGPMATRCAEHPEMLHPVTRYVNGWRALRFGDMRHNLVVAAITGVPSDLVRDPFRIDYEALLADERMRYRRTPDGRNLEAACSFGGVGSAHPARRIVEAIRPFGEVRAGLVQSICATDFGPAMEAIGRLVASRLCGPII
ncbi:MAG: hypothetical protein RMK74_11115 [Myxococcales bacterium]|nr:hypothetical protein [Myxococcales bacterium]